MESRKIMLPSFNPELNETYHLDVSLVAAEMFGVSMQLTSVQKVAKFILARKVRGLALFVCPRH
jgi:hypothetical protein